MSYRIPLPPGGRRAHIDLVDPTASAVQRWIRHKGLSSFEPPTVAALLSVFELQGDDLVFFDVGANIGLYAAMCAAMFDPVAVHAFEPAPTTASMARKVMRSNRLSVDVIECALADHSGTAPLHYSPISDASNSMVSGFRESVESVDVRTTRLDDHVESTGVIPTVLKIDVETFEPLVLAGATTTISRYRPYIVIEVLARADRDLGVPINEAMAGLGYTFYALSLEPNWQPRQAITGLPGVHASDWLLSPEPLPSDFGERWQRWSDRLVECGPEHNPRLPISRSVAAAWHRGGPREIVATARRHVSMPKLQGRDGRRVR